MSKSGDWYKKLRENDPIAYKNLMNLKNKRRKENLAADPIKFAQSKFVKQRAEAVRRGYSWELTKDQVHDMIINTKFCSISGLPLTLEVDATDGSSIDRIDSNKGYFTDNVQVVSKRVNVAKNTMTDEEFIKMCESVTNHQKKLKKLKQKGKKH